jgi:hypothetical protein
MGGCGRFVTLAGTDNRHPLGDAFKHSPFSGFHARDHPRVPTQRNSMDQEPPEGT